MNFLDNRLNPLLLRELRQLVRNRFIIVLINLFIAVLVTVCIMAVLLDIRPQDRGIGAGLFVGLTSIMGIACFLAVVVYTAIITASERINGDLMFVSALKPSSIVFGKFFSGVILTILLMSVTFPFVTLAYLLRGLDIQHVFLSFATTFLMIQMMNALAIFVFSNVKTYVQMMIALVVAGILLGIAAFNGLLQFFLGFGGGHRFLFVYGSPADAWIPIVSTLLWQTALLVFFLAAAVATIAPPTTNRMLPLRIVIVAIYLLSLAYGGFVFGWNPDFVEGWGRSWLVALLPLLLLVVCERETWTYRVRKTIPGHFLLRMLVFPFYTGSPCGLAWTALLGVGIMAAAFLTNPPSFDLNDNRWLIVFVLLFAVDYCITALLFRSFFLSKSIPPDKTWTLVLVQLLVFTFGSMTLYYLAMGDETYDTGDRYSKHFSSALNPFLISDNVDQTFRIAAATTWAILLSIPFVYWFGRRVAEFTPTTPSDVMTLADAVAIVRHADDNPLVKGRRKAGE